MDTIGPTATTPESTPRPDREVSSAPAAWATLSVLLVLLTSLVVAGLAGAALPGVADRYVPARVSGNLALITADATLQLVFGSAMIVLAVTYSRYLGTDGLLSRLALIGGVSGGVAFIAAGAILQETVFYSVFVDSNHAAELALASGVGDLTGLNLAISVVSGGMRSAGSYAFGLAWVGWAVIGMRSGRLPRLLSVIGIIAGLGFAFTNWVGPLAGPFAFFGSLIWFGGLAVVLLRRAPRRTTRDDDRATAGA